MICGVKNSFHILTIWCQPVNTVMQLDGEIGPEIRSEINMIVLWNLEAIMKGLYYIHES